MAYYVRFELKEDLDWLTEQVNRLHCKAQANISAYVEYADRYQRLVTSLEDARTTPPDVPVVPVKSLPVEKKKRAPRGSKKQEQVALRDGCETHPAYRALRVPRTECEGCWKAYAKYNPTSPHLRRRKQRS